LLREFFGKGVKEGIVLQLNASLAICSQA